MTHPEVGQEAPGVQVTDLNGRPFGLEEPGGPTLLIFLRHLM